jgi:hypothetical protein
MMMHPSVDTSGKFTWGRWGAWAAHLFDGDRQVCNTRHGAFGALARGPQPPKFDAAPALGPGGVPYGRTCTHCLKVWNRSRSGLG